jgi:hypothetical protein
MSRPLRAAVALLLSAAITWAAPLAGLLLSGTSIDPYLSFPPRTRFVPHAPFSCPAFVAIGALALATVALYVVAFARAEPRRGSRERSSFPAWGWLGLLLMVASWLAAWHGDLPPQWRRHVFTPLWLGYVLLVNALTVARSGHCPLTHRTRWYLCLFPVSALYWWLFEHLNRFAGNWYYEGIVASGGLDYFLQGTLPFATVLPAVAGTWAWLQTFPRMEAIRLPAIRGNARVARIALLVGATGLAGIGLWPDRLFWLLWLAPLLIVTGLQYILLGESLFAAVARGDWSPVLQPALAALICGLLWELWNWGSLAKWHYSIPYVERFHLFEMPLLGYAGYLPFGLECAVVMDLVSSAVRSRST